MFQFVPNYILVVKLIKTLSSVIVLNKTIVLIIILAEKNCYNLVKNNDILVGKA